MNDPVEEYVSQSVHETLSITLPGFVKATRHAIQLGGDRDVMRRIVRNSKNSEETKLLMETEIDYLIAESQREA